MVIITHLIPQLHETLLGDGDIVVNTIDPPPKIKQKKHKTGNSNRVGRLNAIIKKTQGPWSALLSDWSIGPHTKASWV